MTTILKNAFEKASQLPDAAQELLARQLLDDIEAELKWNDTLNQFSAIYRCTRAPPPATIFSAMARVAIQISPT